MYILCITSKNRVFAWVDINVSSSVDHIILHQVVLDLHFQTMSNKIQFSIPLGQKSMPVYAPFIIHTTTQLLYRSTLKNKQQKNTSNVSFNTNLNQLFKNSPTIPPDENRERFTNASAGAP